MLVLKENIQDELIAWIHFTDKKNFFVSKKLRANDSVFHILIQQDAT